MTIDMSHPAWGAWIEIADKLAEGITAQSHPAWGAWIEIFSALRVIW